MQIRSEIKLIVSLMKTSNDTHHTSNDHPVVAFQWEFQDPKMEVPYFRPYFLWTFPYTALTVHRPIYLVW